MRHCDILFSSMLIFSSSPTPHSQSKNFHIHLFKKQNFHMHTLNSKNQNQENFKVNIKILLSPKSTHTWNHRTKIKRLPPGQNPSSSATTPFSQSPSHVMLLPQAYKPSATPSLFKCFVCSSWKATSLHHSTKSKLEISSFFFRLWNPSLILYLNT
jgi:hypothetical protein